MKSLIIILLLIVTTPVFAQYKITDYTRDTNVSDDDIVCGANSPASGATNACFTLGQLRTSIGSSGVNWGSIGGLATAQNWSSLNMYVNGTNIGLGENTPTALLHLSSTAAANILQVDDDGTGDTSPLVIASDGNVGIGTATPGRPLDINGNTRIRGTWAHYYGDDNQTFLVASAATGGGLNFWSQGSNKFNILPTSGLAANFPAGNIGISTTAPNAKLEITSTAAHDMFVVNDNGAGDTTPFVINLSGNVGIGSATPNGALVIRTSTNDIGWTPVNSANQACNTTCVAGCVFGIDTAAVGNILACTDATADSCLCAGSN